LAIPNEIAASDLLRTRYLEYLSQNHRVVVLSQTLDGAAAAAGAYHRSANVIYLKRALGRPGFWSVLKTLRLAWVNEFDYLTSIKYWYKRPNYSGNWKRRALRFFGRPLSRFLTADFFSAWERRLLPKSPAFAELLKMYRPALLVLPTPGFSAYEAELITLARIHGLPTVAMNFSWDNLTMNAKHIRKTDFLIAWNNIMKKEAMDIHRYPEDKVFVSGTPRFDPYFTPKNNEPSRDEFLRSKGLDPEYKTIFHTTVTKAYPFQKKYIQDLIALREQKKIPYCNIFIRIHPLDLFENYREFLGVKDLTIEKSGEKVEMNYADLLNLKYSLQYTDLNLNYASTISIEACIFDKPVINIGYIGRFALAYEFNHYRPIYEAGAVRLAKTNEDLPKLINMYLENPALDRENRRRVVEDFVKFTDGRSYQRSVDLLDKIKS